MQDAKPFRMLSNDEFAALTTDQKAEYLKAAIDAQRQINEQIAQGRAQMVIKESEE